jgi:hypothetical protein
MAQITAERSGAVGSGLATIADDGTILDAWFPNPRLSQQVDSCGTVDLSDQALAELGEAAAILPLQKDVRRKVTVRAVRTLIESWRRCVRHLFASASAEPSPWSTARDKPNGDILDIDQCCMDIDWPVSPK